MLELGADSDKEHQAILRFAARIKPDQIVLVGPAFGKTDFKKYHALHFAHVDETRAWFVEQNLENTMILIKGSRGIRLEKILETA
jgi:UDP-N-acetylmuramoyl-tripeptide--D-alanyl-D-alanine ligase